MLEFPYWQNKSVSPSAQHVPLPLTAHDDQGSLLGEDETFLCSSIRRMVTATSSVATMHEATAQVVLRHGHSGPQSVAGPEPVVFLRRCASWTTLGIKVQIGAEQKLELLH